jgi:hypothetical protein
MPQARIIDGTTRIEFRVAAGMVWLLMNFGKRCPFMRGMRGCRWTSSISSGLPRRGSTHDHRLGQRIDVPRAILAKGLEATAGTWPEVRAAFGWVWRAAAILGNKKGREAAHVRRRYRDLITALARRRGSLGDLSGKLGRQTRRVNSDFQRHGRAVATSRGPVASDRSEPSRQLTQD